MIFVYEPVVVVVDDDFCFLVALSYSKHSFHFAIVVVHCWVHTTFACCFFRFYLYIIFFPYPANIFVIVDIVRALANKQNQYRILLKTMPGPYQKNKKKRVEYAFETWTSVCHSCMFSNVCSPHLFASSYTFFANICTKHIVKTIGEYKSFDCAIRLFHFSSSFLLHVFMQFNSLFSVSIFYSLRSFFAYRLVILVMNFHILLNFFRMCIKSVFRWVKRNVSYLFLWPLTTLNIMNFFSTSISRAQCKHLFISFVSCLLFLFRMGNICCSLFSFS